MGLNLIHSYSLRPMRINCYGRDSMLRMFGNIWYFALSVAYARNAGASITLHTDTLGKALLGHLPYDDILLTLDDLPADLHPRFWAAGKMWALEAAPLGSVHIDGDVFLKRKALVDDIARSEWDFIAQHYESSEWYEKENILFDRHPEICYERGLDHHLIGAYNTGIIGFRNASLRQEYISGYKHMALSFSRLETPLLDADTDLTPDVMIEQRYVYQICNRNKANVKLMLPDAHNHCKQATEKGYQHVLTSTKFDMLDKAQATLKKVSPEIYKTTLRLCKDVFPK